jgi:hypothetical protein
MLGLGTKTGAMGALAAKAGALALLVAAMAPSGAQATRATHRVHLSAHARPRHVFRHRGSRALAREAIIGGHTADVGTFPWMAFIVDERGTGFALCTGTVVAPNLILTAGHCAEDVETGIANEPSGYGVVTGNVGWTNKAARQVSGVSRVIVYPGFESNGPLRGWGDAALLELATPTSAPAVPIATAAQEELWQADAPAVMAGWGRTYYEQETLTELLQWAHTVVQGSQWCLNNAPGFHPLGQLCTIDPPSYETASCEGDSGGPLIAESTAGPIEIGIVSSGYNHCSTIDPTVFTRAELISPWAHSWIAALRPALPPPQASVPGPTSPPAPAQAAPGPPPGPPNAPGYYVTRRSRTRKIVIHVSGDGQHVVGMSIMMPVRCQHGRTFGFADSWLTYTDNLVITNHAVRGTLEWLPSGETKRGTIGVFLRFTASGSLEGRFHVHLPHRSRRIGVCAETFKFTAKTER